MVMNSEQHVYPKASKSFENLTRAIQIFEDYVKEDSTSVPGDFYRARNFLKEGEKYYLESLAKAKKLLGPLPEYVTEDYQKWREEFVEKYLLVIKSHEMQDVLDELLQDEFLKVWMTKEEIENLLNLNYLSQKEGKRKISNIKIRILLHRLTELTLQAQDLQKRALEKQKQAP